MKNMKKDEMTPETANPFGMMRRFTKDMDRLFNDFEEFRFPNLFKDFAPFRMESIQSNGYRRSRCFRTTANSWSGRIFRA